MNKTLVVPMFFAVMFLYAFQSSTLVHLGKSNMEFEQVVLSRIIDSSADAAVQAMLESPDLGLDYAKGGFIQLDPNVALNTFVDYLLMSYDLPLTDGNRDMMKLQYITGFVVASYDGYYVAHQEIVGYEDGNINAPMYGIDMGLKRPYSYYEGGTTYALNLGGKSGYSINGNTISKLDSNPAGLSKEEQLRVITSLVSTDLAHSLDKQNRGNTTWHHSLYIPTGLTEMNRVNPIDGPTVIAIVQDIDFRTVRPISSFGLGGSAIEEKRQVVGYTRMGRKYYTYADLAPPVALEAMFGSMQEAAEAGYYVDVEFMK